MISPDAGGTKVMRLLIPPREVFLRGFQDARVCVEGMPSTCLVLVSGISTPAGALRAAGRGVHVVHRQVWAVGPRSSVHSTYTWWRGGEEIIAYRRRRAGHDGNWSHSARAGQGTPKLLS